MAARLKGSFLCVYNAQDLSKWHEEIAASLKARGELPEELSDIATATYVGENEDGSPRYRIDWA